ncbi:MAG: type III pantothenate kinase, partial [Bacteroidota bacterium]
MNLIIDVGNTRTKVGVFEKGQLIKKTSWKKEWTVQDAKKITARFPISQMALSAVADYDTGTEAYFRQHYYYLKLTAQTPLPFKNLYKSPKTLGKDRLAGIAGACQLHPGKACLVIDAGTCITYDIIDKEGAYHGGNISPGIRMRFQAMHQFTDRLPLVKPRKDSPWIGYNTRTALRSGGAVGAVMEMEG